MILLAIQLGAMLAMQSHAKPAHHSAATGDVAAVRKFVQSFYDWYIPKAFGNGDAELVTLKTKASMFSPSLRSALMEDWVASSKSKDEIVGLDFDPFLNSQDPDKHYSVGKVEHKGHSWLVDVRGTTDKDSPKPDVVAQVDKGRHGWMFTNFLYGEGNDLVGTLRQLKHDRKK